MLSKQTKQYDLIVVGGGPAGMMAAGRAAELGKKVLLLEKNTELGKKLSITGGGRCNIFNAEEDTAKLLSNYGDSSKFLYSPFSKFGMAEVYKFFEKKKLPITIEAKKRAFPTSQKASDVVNVLKKYLRYNNVEVKTGVKVSGFKTESNKIVGVKTKDPNVKLYKANSYILATGGASHIETGSTGEGMFWLKKIGHTVYDSNPDIVPLKVAEDWVKDLSGTTLSFIKITFGADHTKKTGRFSKLGKILFTHFGVSGPLILNSSNQVKKMLKNGYVKTVIDMYPDTDIHALRNRVLTTFNKNKNKIFRNVVVEFLPAGMHQAFLKQFSPEIQKIKIHSITKEMRYKITDVLKYMPFTITGSMGMDWAVISDGGVDLKEIDTKTMKSKLYSNLYLIGDVLHINRHSGGFSLQLCWTTGYVAGSNI